MDLGCPNSHKLLFRGDELERDIPLNHVADVIQIMPSSHIIFAGSTGTPDGTCSTCKGGGYIAQKL